MGNDDWIRTADLWSRKRMPSPSFSRRNESKKGLDRSQMNGSIKFDNCKTDNCKIVKREKEAAITVIIIITMIISLRTISSHKKRQRRKKETMAKSSETCRSFARHRHSSGCKLF